MAKLLIFSAPSGSGKSTLIRHLLSEIPNLHFSISATSRLPRGEEQHGKEYYFLTPEEFRKRISNHEFLEYEEVYPNMFYGTLKSEVDRKLAENKNVVFDVDCMGGLRIKEMYGPKALSLFVMPPSIETLRERLEKRGTDSPEVIESRLQKAEYEMSFAPKFDVIIPNDNFDEAKEKAASIIKKFIEK
ncbi:guanylate kinase [Limibacterium fermenti]|uniref:guanylate kinase n=1 Tax=Limibacterium fermenti TaxID=3229863 RepID=UPI000E8DD618|nr:guanylate kinase [Porphyromonadaceae bacterium]HBX46535.1 guanylate kinase [Porphyromonadaceae bacterium]